MGGGADEEEDDNEAPAEDDDDEEEEVGRKFEFADAISDLEGPVSPDPALVEVIAGDNIDEAVKALSDW